MARTSKTASMLDNSDGNGHPCLFPDLGGNAFSFSPFRMMFAVGLSNMAFTMLRYRFPLCLFPREFSSQMGIEFCQKIFLHLLLFDLLIWYIMLIDLHILKNSCIPEKNLTWLWYMILLMCC